MKSNQIIQKILVGILNLSLLSCGPPDVGAVDNLNGLTVSTASTSTYIVPGGGVMDCDGTTILKAPYVKLPIMRIGWANPNPLTVTDITVRITSGALTTHIFEKIYSNTSMMTAWVPSFDIIDTVTSFCKGSNNPGPPCLPNGLQINSTTPLSGIVGNTIYRTNSCSFNIGEIPFQNPRSPASGYIEVILNGYYDAGAGEVRSISFKNNLNFSYPGKL
jgi:hypothetical protein